MAQALRREEERAQLDKALAQEYANYIVSEYAVQDLLDEAERAHNQ